MTHRPSIQKFIHVDLDIWQWMAMDNGARKALIPLENKRNFLEVSGEIVERVDPVFFADPMTAAMKELGVT